MDDGKNVDKDRKAVEKWQRHQTSFKGVWSGENSFFYDAEETAGCYTTQNWGNEPRTN